MLCACVFTGGQAGSKECSLPHLFQSRLIYSQPLLSQISVIWGRSGLPHLITELQGKLIYRGVWEKAKKNKITKLGLRERSCVWLQFHHYTTWGEFQWLEIWDQRFRCGEDGVLSVIKGSFLLMPIFQKTHKKSLMCGQEKVKTVLM